MNQSVVIGIVAYAQPGISSLGLLMILLHPKVPVVSVVGNAPRESQSHDVPSFCFPLWCSRNIFSRGNWFRRPPCMQWFTMGIGRSTMLFSGKMNFFPNAPSAQTECDLRYFRAHPPVVTQRREAKG